MTTAEHGEPPTTCIIGAGCSGFTMAKGTDLHKEIERGRSRVGEAVA